MDSTTFIALLPQQIQDEIKKDLIQANIQGKELQIALSGRLCDLEDTINIQKYLNYLVN